MSFIRILAINRQDDAEEVFQRTCMVLWQKFDQFDGENFGAWACRIAHFEMLKFRDSRKRVRILQNETIELLALAALPVADNISERRAALTQCLKKLPDGDHRLIQQRYYDELSIHEISDHLGRSTHAVYREFSRIHGLLSRCIERSLTEACP